jgi:hypothetical protein
MHGCHQTDSIPANIEHREFPHLVCGGENRPKFRKRSKVAAFHLSVQCSKALRVSGCRAANSFNRFRVITCISLPELYGPFTDFGIIFAT